MNWVIQKAKSRPGIGAALFHLAVAGRPTFAGVAAAGTTALAIFAGADFTLAAAGLVALNDCFFDALRFHDSLFEL